MKVRVEVPATANLGPGYDCIGIALDLWNEVEFEISSSTKVIVEGEGDGTLPLDESNAVVQGFQRLYEYVGKPVPDVTARCKNRIPIGRGLGSSSAAVVSGMIGAGLFLWGSFSEHQKEMILSVACEFEGHPDSVAPCLFGGLQLGCLRSDDKSWVAHEVQFDPALRCVLFVTNKHAEEIAGRKLLGPKVMRKDAIFNIGRLGMFVNAMRSGEHDKLKDAMQDRMLEERTKATSDIIEHAYKAGAFGACVTGSGPSILTFVDHEKIRSVSNAMDTAAKECGIPGSVEVINPIRTGAKCQTL